MFCLKEIIYHNYNVPTKGIIINIENNDSAYSKIKIKSHRTKYLLSTKDKYQVGDVVYIDGIIEESIIHYPYGFDYKSYLHFKNIHELNDVTIYKIKHRFTIHSINDRIKHYIETNFNDETCAFIKTLTIGDASLLDKTNINKIGISHLFVISGLHVSVIILVLTKILSLFKTKDNTKDIILIIIIGIYVVSTDFMISVIRVYLTLILKKLLKLNALDTLSLNIIIVSIINPFIIFNLSFILSYAIAFFMLIYEDLVHIKKKLLNKIINMYLLTILIQTFTLPITISINPDFNLLSLIVNPIFIYFVSYLFLPLSFVTLFIPPISYIYEPIVNIFQNSINYLANINVLTISLGNINIYFKLIYWVIFYLTLNFIYRKKYQFIIIYVVILGIWFFKGIFNLNDKIYFLDLPEGESTIIVSKNQSRVIVVDTGEVTKDHIFTKIIKNLGIKKIDYLIITHSDSDHIGGSYDLINWIRPKRVIFNYYDKNQNTYNLAKFSKEVYFLKSGNVINDKYFKLEVLTPSHDYKNVNDNCLTFIISLDNFRLLMMGDASTKIEKELLNKKFNVNVYKVAHHGSLTSTSIEFLERINYEYAVIMSGYYNTFGFPKEGTINKFPKEKLLLTKNKGTIIFVKRGKNYKLKECKKILSML